MLARGEIIPYASPEWDKQPYLMLPTINPYQHEVTIGRCGPLQADVIRACAAINRGKLQNRMLTY